MNAKLSTNLRQWWTDTTAWLRERGLELWIITGIWAILSLVIYLLATGHESPRRYQDEFFFWALAKNFAAGDGLSWRGVAVDMKSWLYPVLISPVFWFAKSIPGQYTGVHLLSSLMICATIFPAYLLGRLYVDRWRALLMALMTVSVPAMNYAGIIGTENLGYLTFTAACGAMLLALARPRPRNTILAFATILVAVLTRTQFIVLGPIFAGTLLLAAAMAEPGKRVAYLKERRVVWISLLVALALAGLIVLIRGKAAVGLYSGVFNGAPLTWSAMWFWLKAFAADVYLLTAIVPVIATFAMFGRAENRRDPLVGALLALALVASVLFVAQIAWFSATNPYDWRSRHIFYERYMFYLGPIFFAGLLVAWKRVGWTAALVSTAIATAIVSGFQTDAVLVPFSYDSFGLSLVGRHMSLHPDVAPKIGMMLARLTFVLGLLYVVSCVPNKILERVLYWGLVGFTFVALVASQAQTWHYARTFSTQAFDQFPKPANFIDKNADQPVGMIITSTDDPLAYFTTEFWNNQVVRAFATDNAPIKSPIIYSPKCEFDWSKTGEILGTGCDLVPNAWYLRSDNVVMHLKDETERVHPSDAWPTLTLMVGEAPPRILSLLDGRAVRTGVVNGQLNVRTFLDKPGQMRLRMRGDGATKIVREDGGDSVVVEPRSSRTLTVDVPADENLASFTVKTAAGIQDSVVVTGIDVREPGGKWMSIL